MEKHHYITMIFVFVTGIFAGMYMFTSGFMQQYGAPDVQTQIAADSFVLVAEVYGGCRDSCPSFQVIADGTYRYLFTPGFEEDQIIREGELPRALRREISDTFLPITLQTQSVETDPAVCNSFTDGIDVQYRITLAGEDYILDTCGTAVDTSSALWQTLLSVWNYLETGSV